MERGVLHSFTGVFESVENFRSLKDIDIPKVMMRGCHQCCDRDIIALQGLIPTKKDLKEPIADQRAHGLRLGLRLGHRRKKLHAKMCLTMYRFSSHFTCGSNPWGLLTHPCRL